jgi:hypothetical protein
VPAPTPIAPGISAPVAFPNPCNNYQNLNIRFDTLRDCSNISFKLYTDAFRLIYEADNGACAHGTVNMQIPVGYINGLANGTYYYLITGIDAVLGMETRAKAEKLIIIK